MILNYNVTFISAMLYLIYVGAVLILFVFLILTLDTTSNYSYTPLFYFLPSIILVFVDLFHVNHDLNPILENIGHMMFNDYLSIHLISLVLLTTLIATISLLLTT